MKNDFLNLNSVTNKDIAKYLCTAFEHLDYIITNLELLSEKDSEKEHVIDILNECLYIQEDLYNLTKNYIEFESDNAFEKIETSFKNIYSIEEELIIDYPEVFKNEDNQWWKYTPFVLDSESQLNIAQLKLQQKIHKNINLKRWAFGIFFLLPAFLFIVFYPMINNKINHLEEKKDKQHIYEHDRAYKNIFYIYSAVLSNKEHDNNFYSLFRTSSFQMPEGFVVIDKNLMVDYYLKEYYGLNHLESDPNTTIISVTNLNFIQCKYILTKLSALSIEKVISNDQVVDFDNNFKSEQHCNEAHKANIISLYVKK